MKQNYKQTRIWTIQQLRRLETLCDDPNLGIKEDRRKSERKEIAARINHIRTGKYRIVFLGAFNVGKSTLINAMLGAAYLPAVLEECTAKLVHLIPSEDTRLRIRIDLLSEDDTNKIKKLCGDGGKYFVDGQFFNYSFDGAPAPLRISQLLEALITVGAHDTNSAHRKLAERITEVELYLPLPEWAEDIVLTDSPGVNSISDTREDITYRIIPKSQLVVLLIDSESAGNRPDLEFVRRIVENRHRHIFFVINKADQLDEDEIDNAGRRGPAKGLRRSLAGCVKEPEVFFVSALYGLKGRQLAKGDISIQQLKASNKIKLPLEFYAGTQDKCEELKKISEHLVSASRISRLEKRIGDYLHNENKEFALVQDGLTKIIDLGGEFASTLARQLEIARDPTKIEEFKSYQNNISLKLERIQKGADDAINVFNTRINGGEIGENEYSNPLTMPRDLFSYDQIDESVIRPMREWLDEQSNFEKTISDKNCSPAIQHYIGLVDDMVSRAHGKLQEGIDSATTQLQSQLTKLLEEFQGLNIAPLAKTTTPCPEVDVSRAKGIAASSLAGASTGAGIGVWFYGPLGATIGAGIGGLVGWLGCVFLSDEDSDILLGKFEENARQWISDGYMKGENKQPSIREKMEDNLDTQQKNVSKICRRLIKGKCDHLMEEFEKLIAQDKKTAKERNLLINRMEPILKELTAMLDEAQKHVRGQ